ncbi:hypothetical protein JCGZ_22574 [Jatropha curcas]|uniref:Uncharacterized protein n=1 Tax=Jatropha curcas TaxID=180498 RepID=A0A067JZR2_JATCU|nr:uncharacterized protein LOC105646134 [Jatropha curcas]KDP25039.1 hypothetical protein JCGZ_22574 [Jatropha curcas]
MEQPSIPIGTPSKDKPSRKKPPTPQELISHYQSQGLDSQEASVKVIEDLQNVLFKVISANNKNKKDKFMAEASRKVDVVNNRVALLDMKLDSKPGYVETFAIGIASGAAFRGIECVWPHVVGGISQIWAAARSVTKPPHSS